MKNIQRYDLFDEYILGAKMILILDIAFVHTFMRKQQEITKTKVKVCIY